MTNASPTNTLKAFAPPSKREVLTYALFVSFLLLFLAIVLMLERATLPRPEYVEIGAAGGFANEVPTVLDVTGPDNSRLHIWITYVDGRWYAFDGRTPSASYGGCFYQWESATSRFEDPCTGFKFSRTGQFLGSYCPSNEYLVRDLDQYPVRLRDGRLFVYVSRITHNEPQCTGSKD